MQPGERIGDTHVVRFSLLIDNLSVVVFDNMRERLVNIGHGIWVSLAAQFLFPRLVCGWTIDTLGDNTY